MASKDRIGLITNSTLVLTRLTPRQVLSHITQIFRSIVLIFAVIQLILLLKYDWRPRAAGVALDWSLSKASEN